MATDVKLDQGDGSFVVVEGRVLKVAGSDLILDSRERRRESQTPNRRALVHDARDGLTINFDGDYPGGVTVNGNTAVTGELILAGTSLTTELQSLRIELESLQRTSSSRIDLLETTVASLVALAGAVIIPPWKTKTEVEQGDDEAAVGGGPATPSAAALGLVVEVEFDRLRPGFGHEDVVSIEPVAGTAVKPGSTVKVTVNLNG